MRRSQLSPRGLAVADAVHSATRSPSGLPRSSSIPLSPSVTPEMPAALVAQCERLLNRLPDVCGEVAADEVPMSRLDAGVESAEGVEVGEMDMEIGRVGAASLSGDGRSWLCEACGRRCCIEGLRIDDERTAERWRSASGSAERERIGTGLAAASGAWLSADSASVAGEMSRWCGLACATNVLRMLESLSPRGRSWRSRSVGSYAASGWGACENESRTAFAVVDMLLAVGRYAARSRPNGFVDGTARELEGFGGSTTQASVVEIGRASCRERVS